MADAEKEKEQELEKTKTAASATITASAAVAVSSTKPASKASKNSALAEAAAVNQQNQQNQNIKKLVDAIKKMSDSIKPKKTPSAGKDGALGMVGAIGKTLSDLRKDKLGGVKKLFTKEGALGALSGVGGVAGTIAGGAAEKLKTAKEEEQKKTEWTSAYLESTAKGKKLTKTLGAEGAGEEAKKLYDEKVKLEEEVADLKQKQKEKKATGVLGADISKEEQKTLEKSEKRLGVLAGGPERIRAAKMSETKVVPTVTALPAKLSPAGVSGIIAAGEPDGKIDELLDINQDQLEILEKILGASTESEESRLESKKLAAPSFTALGKKEEKPEEKGLFQTLLGGLSGIFSKGMLRMIMGIAPIATAIGGLTKLLGPLASILGLKMPSIPGAPGSSPGVPGVPDGPDGPDKNKPGQPPKSPDGKKPGALSKMSKMASFGKNAFGTAARFAGPTAAVIGAGVAGYQVGGLLNEYVLNPAAEAITGNKDETVGSAAYSGVDKMKGMLGFKTDADKEKELERSSYEDIYKKRLAEKTVSPQLAKKMEEYGIKTPPDAIKTKTSTQPAAPAANPVTTAPTPKPATQAPSTDKTEPVITPVAKPVSAPPKITAIPAVDDSEYSEEEIEAAANYKAGDTIQRHIIRTTTGLSDDELRTIAKRTAKVNTPAVTPSQTQPTPAQPRAVTQTAAMQSRTADVEDARSQQKPIIVHAPSAPASGGSSSISTNTTIVRPDTRSQEPTFNKMLNRNFSFT